MSGRKIKQNEWLEYGYSEEEWKSFHKSKRWRIKNPSKQKQSCDNWNKSNTDYRKNYSREWQLRNRYGISEENYQNLLKLQNGKCGICSKDKPTGKWKVFVVDHCHITGQVRGLLCNECNRGIGLLKDSKELLIKAHEYLMNAEKAIAKEYRKK